jgi:endonuclease VIII
MPEGDTIFRTATVLRRVLAGQVVTGFEIENPKITAMARDEKIVGSTVSKVEPNGKHLLIHFSTPKEAVLHTHMKMSGTWHVYRPGERWWRPKSEARVVITTENVVAVCFHPPICELLTAGELGLHPVVGALGPDILRDDFDVEVALRRLRAKPDRDVATALLDQKVISGIGNAFKVDALFLAKTNPWALVSDLDDAKLREIVDIARKLMLRNLKGGARRTRFSLDPSESVWVMERGGLPCHVCGTIVEQGWHPGEDVRKSWYCPKCQNVDRAKLARPAPTPTMPMSHPRDRL